MVMLANKHNGYSADGRRLYFFGGGSSGQQSTQLPAWAEEAAKNIVGKGEALMEQPYEAYTGKRVAGLEPLQVFAKEGAAALTPAAQLGAATTMAQRAGDYGMGAEQAYRQLAAPDIASLRGTGAAYEQALAPDIATARGTGADIQRRIDPALEESLRAGRAYQAMATDPSQMAAYMSPYMQNVVDIEKREAQRLADIAATGRGAQAARAGAFGGSRQAIMEAEAERNLAQQLADIQARGGQRAFEAATQAQQFGSELGLRGLGQGLQAQQAASQLGLSGLGQAIQAQQYGQDLGLRGTQAALAGTQFGSDLGMRGAQLASQAAQTLGGLGATQFGQQKDIIGLQRQLGMDEQALEQARLDTAYQQFQEKQRYPYEQLSYMSSLLRGTPLGQTTMYQAPQASPLQTILGMASLGKGFNLFNEGGAVNRGLTGLALKKFEE